MNKTHTGDIVNGWLVVRGTKRRKQLYYRVLCPVCNKRQWKTRRKMIEYSKCQDCTKPDRITLLRKINMTKQELLKLEEKTHRLIKDLYPDDAVTFYVNKLPNTTKFIDNTRWFWSLCDPIGCFECGSSVSQEAAYQDMISLLEEKAEE